MTRVLVLNYSSYGHVRALAQAEAEGARSVHGTHVDLRRVPETVLDEVRQKAGFAPDDTPVAAPTDLDAYDAIISGTPTLFGIGIKKIWQHRCYDCLSEGAEGVHLEMPAHRARAVPDAVFDLGHSAENGIGLVIIEPPGIGQGHGSGGARQQRGPQTFLK